MKYYIIAGEASGDLHGSNLIKALREKDDHAEVRCWGGDLMAAAGGTLVKHYKELAFMGFWEVITNLRTILSNLKYCKQDIEAWQPDALILIDYPGFNLRIVKWASRLCFKVFYYISPQIWAWKKERVKIIQKAVDRMFVILPFEQAFYEQYGVEVDFVGHPLLDVIEDFERDNSFLDKYALHAKPIVALLPGSRKQEIKTMLPVMLEMVSEFPEYQFVVAGAPAQDSSFYFQIMEVNNQKIPVVENETYPLLAHAHSALVTSGTATLEAALFNVPEIVCYKGSFISYQIAKRLVDVPYISLVNLVSKKEVVPELIQNDFNSENLKLHLSEILAGPGRERMLNNFESLKALLGQRGASRHTARLIIKYLS